MGRAVGQHRRVHLVGLGYGCSIAAAFASLYPDSVRSVTALSPLGMSEPIPKAQFVDLLKGVRESRAAFTRLVRSLSASPAAFRPPAISGAVWDGWGARGRAPPLNHTTNEHYSKRGFFRSVDEEVAVPTMILCGAEVRERRRRDDRGAQPVICSSCPTRTARRLTLTSSSQDGFTKEKGASLVLEVTRKAHPSY